MDIRAMRRKLFEVGNFLGNELLDAHDGNDKDRARLIHNLINNVVYVNTELLLEKERLEDEE